MTGVSKSFLCFGFGSGLTFFIATVVAVYVLKIFDLEVGQSGTFMIESLLGVAGAPIMMAMFGMSARRHGRCSRHRRTAS